MEQSVLSLLNTGSFKDLMTLRGIGAMRANKVLEHRTNGKHSFEKVCTIYVCARQLEPLCWGDAHIFLIHLGRLRI